MNQNISTGKTQGLWYKSVFFGKGGFLGLLEQESLDSLDSLGQTEFTSPQNLPFFMFIARGGSFPNKLCRERGACGFVCLMPHLHIHPTSYPYLHRAQVISAAALGHIVVQLGNLKHSTASKRSLIKNLGEAVARSQCHVKLQDLWNHRTVLEATFTISDK